jgi:acyl-CoA synthetase (NDP forming)
VADVIDKSQLAQALLAPRGIALIGASDDPGKTAGRPQKFLREAGYQGRVFPINPNRQTVQGERAYPDLASLPEVPEHAFILTPTDGVLDGLRSCAALGVKVATILAGGFSEAGDEGAQREVAVREIARSTGMRILGPSSLGVVNTLNGLVLTANAAFAEPGLPGGSVFVASQSGSMIGALVSRGKARGVGFAGLVSVGGEADLSVGEVCAATLDDPAIEGYLLFLESLGHGEELRSFALEAARRGKPVIAYKLGRSAVAAELATTHTGALAGEDDVADAFFKDMGIARVGVLEALLETFPLAQRVELGKTGPNRRRVGVVTTTGGGAAMAVDQLGIRGITVRSASPETIARLAEANIPGSAGRLIDLTLAGTRYDVMKKALEILLEAPEYDLILAVVGSSARMFPQLAVKPIIDSAGAGKPLAAMLVPDAPEALAQLTTAGVPCFRTPEACADAIAAVFGRRAPPLTPPPSPPDGTNAGTLSEAEGYDILDQLGVPHVPYVLARLSGPVPDLPFAFPVVAKICSAQIPHKTEIGGVVLNIESRHELAQAFARLQANLREKAPGIVCDEVLIQPMRRGLGEVLVGYRVDPQAGPIVMLAAGGIWAEVALDRSIRLAPVDVVTAHEMIEEVQALRVLTGLRGQRKGDLAALAQAIAALSLLAVRPELGVREAEVNPMFVMAEGEGVLALDVLMLTVQA